MTSGRVHASPTAGTTAELSTARPATCQAGTLGTHLQCRGPLALMCELALGCSQVTAQLSILHRQLHSRQRGDCELLVSAASIDRQLAALHMQAVAERQQHHSFVLISAGCQHANTQTEPQLLLPAGISLDTLCRSISLTAAVSHPVHLLHQASEQMWKVPA